jgi:hypothetical protein
MPPAAHRNILHNASTAEKLFLFGVEKRLWAFFDPFCREGKQHFRRLRAEKTALRAK